VRAIVEAYIALLARTPEVAADDAATISFRLADLVRSRPVQKALSESSARAAARDPGLAELARKEQDLGRELGGQLGLLNNVLALPPEDRDEKTTTELRARVERLREERGTVRAETARRFPSYDNLVNPRAPSVEDIRAVLKSTEAFVSMYVGAQRTFTWVVPKDGPVVFSMAPIGARAIAGKIAKLRQALEPHATVVGDIPPFDVAVACELYETLLQPVEAAWKGAEHLFVAADGALGMLPLGLLPTASVKPKSEPGLL
jgi:hypothetical protein